MKKKVLLSLLVIFSIIVIPFLIAENHTEEGVNIETSQIDKAYSCLENQIESITCSKLSPTERIFSLMATGSCKTEMLAASNSGLCWPSSECSLKTTAQAILALEKVSESTTTAENWLLDQNDTPADVDWFLQIEAVEESECEIRYSTGGRHDIRIDEDKTLSGGAGSCLSLASGSWWYRVAPSCYGVEFEISCDKSFLTNLLFKEKTSSTIHVSEKTSSTSAEGITKEKVSSLCLEDDDRCDYEGTLWGAVALNSVGYDVTPYMPYLITGADRNRDLLPESLLYLLTGYDEFRNAVSQKQKNNKYWDESGSKFQDTALALFPFQYSSSPEKTNAIDWLLEVQGKDGCWDGGNVLSNSFLLTSIWPEQVIVNGDARDCEDSGFYCMSSVSCEGETLDSYECSTGVFSCCDQARSFDICEIQGGEVCSSTQECIGGTVVKAEDTRQGQSCCVLGRCKDESPQNECQLGGGICRTFSCGGDETPGNQVCPFGDTCCLPEEDKEGISPWIWILLLLIILVILAIVFRNKLRPHWEKLVSKFRKGRGGLPSPTGRRGPPGFPPPSTTIPLRRRGPPRRILPPQQRRPPRKGRPKTRAKPTGEIDKVLKQLRDISGS